MRNKIAAIVLVTMVICIGLFIVVDSALAEVGVSTVAAPEEEWNVSLGMCGTAYSVQQTSDGGYIIAGETESTSYYIYEYTDTWLIKIDSKGKKEWYTIFGKLEATERPNSVQQTSDGGYILAGIERGLFDTDILLVKTDMEGNVQWNKTFGGFDDEEAYSVRQTTDGGYIIVGYTESFGTETSNYGIKTIDAWLIKTYANGNEDWSKAFGGTDSPEGADYGYSVQQTSDGGYILAGSVYYKKGTNNACLIKTDSNGNEQWRKEFIGTKDDQANSVHLTSDGGYIIAGRTESYGAGMDDAWLIKTDSKGNKQWDKTFGGTCSDSACFVHQTSDGGYIIAGESYEDQLDNWLTWLIKTNSKGDEQWKKTFEGLCFPFHSYLVQQTSDGGYIVAGRTGWLIKFEGTTEKAMKAEVLSPTTDFSVLKGSNVPLKVKVTYEGEPTTGASLTASFSNGDPDVKLTEGENGIYTGTWTPTTIIEGQVESPVEITIEAYHGTLGRVYAKVDGCIHSGTSPIEVSLREIIEEVEKLRDESISKINRDVDNTATLQAKIGKEVYDKEEKNIVINSLQHALGLLSADDNILNYLAAHIPHISI